MHIKKGLSMAKTKVKINTKNTKKANMKNATVKPRTKKSKNQGLWAKISRLPKPVVIVASLVIFSAVGTGLMALSKAASFRYTSYAAHVETKGWMPEAQDGNTAGTTGQAKRLESLRLSHSATTGAFTWRGHVQKIGWQEWRDTASSIGTTGQAKRLEAFQLTIKDPTAAANYSVQYRSHVQKIGWQPWVSDGAISGTTGQALRIEAVQIRVVAKNPTTTQPAPTTPTAPQPTAPTAPAPTTPTAPSASAAVRIAFTADTGMESTGQRVLSTIGSRKPDVTNILGDFAYAPGKEQAFCNQVNSRIPGKVQIVAGNHEEIPNPDGTMENFEKCLPDEVGVTGRYGRDYYYDVGAVRVILISPDIPLTTGLKTYRSGTAELEWLKTAVRQAKAAGKWTIVGMHHPCFSIGLHGCADTTSTVSDVSMSLGVDFVVSGHDHNYSRTHQLRGTKAAPVIVDKDNAYAPQTETSKGSVFAVVGNGGHNPRAIGTKTSIYAAANGTNSSGGFVYGYGEVTATPTKFTYQFVSSGSPTLSDSFTITR